MDSLYTYQVAATDRYFAFIKEDPSNNRRLVVFDVLKNRYKTFITKGGSIVSLSPSTKDGNFLISYSKGITVKELEIGKKFSMSLLQCDVEREKCSKIFDFDGAIGSPIWINDHQIVFSGSRAEISSDQISGKKFVTHRRFDLYIKEDSEMPRQLTNWSAYQLTSLSLGNDYLVYQMVPSSVTAGKSPLLSDVTSRIYTSFIGRDSNPEKYLKASEKPAITYGKNIDLAPFFSSDGKLIAFYSSSTSDNGEWIYDIVVHDNQKNMITYILKAPSGQKISKPLFIDSRRIRFMLFDGNNYFFKELDCSSRVKFDLGSLDASALGGTNSVEIDIDGGR